MGSVPSSPAGGRGGGAGRGGRFRDRRPHGQAQASDDLYRYAWDGAVQAHGIDPYRYPPDDAHVAELRDRWLWPNARTCASWDKEPGCSRLNRPMERTIYPPVA
ncbi:MAG: hypothetical protein M3011_11885, partial [Actinomycetota bacterium]|nr:hypothetical protein [Actinomycetota bacterium]